MTCNTTLHEMNQDQIEYLRYEDVKFKYLVDTPLDYDPCDDNKEEISCFDFILLRNKDYFEEIFQLIDINTLNRFEKLIIIKSICRNLNDFYDAYHEIPIIESRKKGYCSPQIKQLISIDYDESYINNTIFSFNETFIETFDYYIPKFKIFFTEYSDYFEIYSIKDIKNELQETDYEPNKSILKFALTYKLYLRLKYENLMYITEGIKEFTSDPQILHCFEFAQIDKKELEDLESKVELNYDLAEI